MATAKVVFAAEPKDFNGTPAKLQDFNASLSLYFLTYKREFNTDAHKILYTLSKCKEGSTMTFVRNYLTSKTVNSVITIGTNAGFYMEFQSRFTDPNLTRAKQHELDLMQQGTHTAKEFFIEFDLICQQAGYSDATVHITYLINLLEKTVLNKVLIQRIYQTIPIPNTYDAYKASALQHNAQWHWAKAIEAICQGKPLPKQSSTSSTSSATDSKTGHSGCEDAPMDIDATSGKRCKGKKGKTHSHSKLKCFNCGQFGHFAKDCKNKRTMRKYDIWAMSATEKRELLDELAKADEHEKDF
jgi:hypothetical protein